MKICCDTTFLIDLSKDRREAKTAYKELSAKKVQLHTTFLNVSELLAGTYSLPGGKRRESASEVWKMIECFSVLGVEKSNVREVCEGYAELHHRLVSMGKDIPASDKIIIAIGLAHDIKVFLTRDINHYHRVPGIDIIGY